MINRFGIGLIISWLAACSASLNPLNESRSVEKLDSLQTTYYALTDSVNHAWQLLRQDDVQKNVYLQQLLLEMRRSDRYALDTLDTLGQRIKQLKVLNYDTVTAANRYEVRRYDSATVRTSEAIVQYVEGNENYLANPTLVYLTDKILAANRSMMLYRLHYDRWSRAFNAFLDANHDFIATLDSNALRQRQFLFRLTNDRPDRDSL
ncbi:MAG: hypothetical protein WA960_11320 [Tunicatimonas sp.]